jgi:hypothetical protein
LEEKKNKIIANKSFNEKKDIYKTSHYKITTETLNYENWDINNLINRQAQLAKYAKSIWKL